jgi:hypothetical protein
MPPYLPSHVLGSQRNGLNQAGMNLGAFNRFLGPVRGTHYPTYSDALLDWYQAKNVKSVRFSSLGKQCSQRWAEASP